MRVAFGFHLLLFQDHRHHKLSRTAKMRTLFLLVAFSAFAWAQDEDIATSTSGSVAPPPIQPQPPTSQFQPPNLGQVFSFFTGLGQNFQQTFGSGLQQPQQLPGYLVNPNSNAAAATPDTGAPAAPAGGNLILDLMSRAQSINSSSIANAFRDRVDRIAGNNVVIMRLSNLLGQNRTRRQTEEVKPDVDPKPVETVQPEEPKPVEAVPEEASPAKPSETIDDVVKRLKEEREQSPALPAPAPAPEAAPLPVPSAVPPPASPVQPGRTTTFVGTVGQIPTDIFRGLDGLLGVGSISGHGMTSLLDSVTRMIGKNGNVTVARADTHYGAMRMPDTEDRARSLRDRFEERMAKHEERRQEWRQRFRERMDRRRDFVRGNDDSVIKPTPEELPLRKPDLTDPQPVAGF